MTGNVCAACLMKFSDRDKAVKHLAYSHDRCLNLLQKLYVPLDDAVVTELDAASVAVRADSIRSRVPSAPACKLLGPLLHPDFVTINGKKQFS